MKKKLLIIANNDKLIHLEHYVVVDCGCKIKTSFEYFSSYWRACQEGGIFSMDESYVMQNAYATIISRKTLFSNQVSSTQADIQKKLNSVI